MSGIGPSFVGSAHDYTRSEAPWRLEENREAHGATTTGKVFGWRLFHYLAGGGMRTFGRTVRQEEENLRLNRFFVVAAVFGVLWLLFYLF